MTYNYQDDYEGEIWGQYSDFDRYLVSSFGRVKDNKVGCIKLIGRRVKLLETDLRKRYHHTSLRKGGIDYRFSIHTLVLLTFIGERPSGMYACHNNGISTDNRLVNLRWAPPKDNTSDAIEHGSFCQHQLNRSRNFTNGEISVIRSYLHHSKLNYKLAEFYGVSYGVIYDIRNHRTYKHLT